MEQKQEQHVDTNKNESRLTGENNSTLRVLFINALHGLHAAELHLTQAIPGVMAAASDAALQEEFEKHLKQTREHVSRVEQIFELLDEGPDQEEKCDAIEALTKEAVQIIDNTSQGSSTRDAGLIMAAQKIEHYEIATYGSLVQIADTLQMDQVMELLKITLDEEKQTDKNLSEMAQSRINHISVAEVE
jgi:ferritin-like metal-binding protein YciE